MKATGIVRKVDELGRIVIPMELRRTLDIEKEDSVEIFVDDGSIVLRKYEPACIFCGNAKYALLFGQRADCPRNDSKTGKRR